MEHVSLPPLEKQPPPRLALIKTNQQLQMCFQVTVNLPNNCTHIRCVKNTAHRSVSVSGSCSTAVLLPTSSDSMKTNRKKTHAIYSISGATVTTDPPHVQNTSTCFPSACSTPGNDGKTDLIRQKKLAGHFGEAAWLSYLFSLLSTLLV